MPGRKPVFRHRGEMSSGTRTASSKTRLRGGGGGVGVASRSGSIVRSISALAVGAKRGARSTFRAMDFEIGERTFPRSAPNHVENEIWRGSAEGTSGSFL